MADSSPPSTVLDRPLGAAAGRAEGPWRRRWLFALNFLRHPLTVGTLFESSPALVQRLVQGTDWSRCRTVVELGPGVGTVTAALLARLPAEARLYAVERNQAFVAELSRAVPDPRLAVLHGSATDLPTLLAAQCLWSADVLVSGIPFSTLPAAARARVLDAAARLLGAKGQLLVYQHTRLLLPLLRQRFARVEVETEWRNAVPMRVFRCSGAHAGIAGDAARNGAEPAR